MEVLYFETNAFRDPPERVADNINSIEGYRFCEAMQDALRARGFECQEVFDEDFGWAFFTRQGAAEWFCTASLEVSEEGAEIVEIDFSEVSDEPEGETFFRAADGVEMSAHVAATKRRSLMDRLRGRNRQTDDDPAFGALFVYFEAHPDVRALKVVQ